MPSTSTVPSAPMPQPKVLPPMPQPPLVVPITPHVVSALPQLNPRATRKNVGQSTPSKPHITVFVGNISEKIRNVMIKRILATCGNITSWNRVQGFGFCEYYGAEDALCAIKVLHDMEIGGKSLVIKVDSKAQETLDQFKAEKKGSDDSEESQQFEVYCRQRINSIIAEYNDETSKEEEQNEKEDKTSVGFVLVPNELFKKKPNGRHSTPNSPHSEENGQIRRRVEQDKRDEEKRDKPDREKKERREKKKRYREKTREKIRDHGIKSRFREQEIEEEELELKKEDLRQKLREIEYQERLKQWEIRENQKKIELAKESSNQKLMEEERERNAIKLKEFLEDYDDEKDDQKYYKGKELQKRLEIREKEIEEDGRDRQKEKDELEAIRAKIFSSDMKQPAVEFAKVLRTREVMYKPKLLIDVAEEQKEKLKRREMEIKNQKSIQAEQEQQKFVMEKAHTPGLLQPATSPSVESYTPPLEFAPMTQPTTLMIKKEMDVKDVFNNDDEAVEENTKNIRQLIESIPTDKDGLFSFHLDWAVVDNHLMEKRIRPWVNRKIINYIGEPEPILVDFICSKVLACSSPQAILDDVKIILDDEAEMFVVKMWRLLVYEVKAKKLGLVELEEYGHKDP